MKCNQCGAENSNCPEEKKKWRPILKISMEWCHALFVAKKMKTGHDFVSTAEIGFWREKNLD